jgi:hypothetical protein
MRMTLTPARRLSLTWFALAAVTLLAWWIGARHGTAPFAPMPAVSLSVLVISAVKVRVILREFMEVRRAPVLLRRLTDGWLALLFAALFAAYLLPGWV